MDPYTLGPYPLNLSALVPVILSSWTAAQTRNKGEQEKARERRVEVGTGPGASSPR
jgi:hypothetical protein